MISECIPYSITRKQTFNNIAIELQSRFPHNHHGKVGGRDKAHKILTMAIMCSMWCGWLSQTKANLIIFTSFFRHRVKLLNFTWTLSSQTKILGRVSHLFIISVPIPDANPIMPPMNIPRSASLFNNPIYLHTLKSDYPLQALFVSSSSSIE